MADGVKKYPLTGKYGGKTSEAARRAIRAEIPGGGMLLDTIERMNVELHDPRPSITKPRLRELRGVYDRLIAARDWLIREVVIRYNGPAAKTTPGRVPAAAVERLSSESVGSLSRETGISEVTLTRERDRLGIAPHRVDADPHRWTPAMDKLLGTVPDGDLAEKWGRSAEAVRRRRTKLGVKPTRGKRAWTAADDAVVLALPPAEAAGKLGRPLAAVKTRRSRLRNREEA